MLATNSMFWFKKYLLVKQNTSMDGIQTAGLIQPCTTGLQPLAQTDWTHENSNCHLAPTRLANVKKSVQIKPCQESGATGTLRYSYFE